MTFVTRVGRIALWKKFTCLGLLCLAAIVMPSYLYWQEAHKLLDVTAKERDGLPQAHLMLNIIQRTQQHRGLSARYLQDPTMPPQERRSKAEDLESAIFAYEVYFDNHPNLTHKAAFAKTVQQWHSLHQQVAHQKVGALEGFELHNRLINQQLVYLQMIVDEYQLSLDPDAKGYFLIDASLIHLPELTEFLGQIRGLGVGVLSKGSASLSEREQLQALLLVSQAKMESLAQAIQKAEASDATSMLLMDGDFHAIKTQFQKIEALTRTEILDAPQLDYAPEKFYDAFTFDLNSYFSFAHFAVERLDAILAARIAAHAERIYFLLACVLLFTVLVAFACIGFVRKLLQQLGGDPHYANEVVQAIASGHPVNVIDIKHPDSLLANVQRMQKKLNDHDRLKSEYISTLSHDLRTPLTAISGALSLSVSGQLGVLPESALKMLSVAQKSSLRLTELINDLLDIDKLALDNLEMDMRVQPLMPIVDEACMSMAAYMHKHGVHIVPGPRYELLLVKVDARRLQQIIVNLLANATKFSVKGDEVELNLSVSFDKVRMDVIDHGRGIPEGFRDHVFKKFAANDSSDAGAVAGLGLAVSKGVIEQMNGTIGFVSTEGAGSCFYVELPLEEANSD